MASIFTSSGATFSISETSDAPATFDAAGYADLTFSQQCPLESMDGAGVTFDVSTFDDLCTSTRLKVKGIADYGELQVVLGLDDTQANQDFLTTASEDTSTADWHFKIELPNKQNATGTNAVRYFSGKVTIDNETFGAANDIPKRNATISITTPIVKVSSTAGV